MLRGRGYGLAGERIDWYRLFKAKGSLIVLCHLSSVGTTTKYGIMRSLKLSKEAISHAVEVLASLGLCATFREPSFPFRVSVQLTDLGMQLLSIRVGDLLSFLAT